MDRIHLYRNIPSKGQLEITVAYTNKWGNGPQGTSLAKLRERAEGDEVTVKDPEGNTYKFSLAPWANNDAEQTFLLMIFRSTPQYPVQIDPTLLSESPFPRFLPKSSELSSIATPGSDAELRVRPSSNTMPSPSFISHESQGHKIIVRASQQQTGITIREILTFPEIATEQGIVCPLCDTILHTGEAWQQFFGRAATTSDGDEAILEVSISHPGDQPETKMLPEHYPFSIQRCWHFLPAVTASSQKLINILDEVDFSLAVKSHDHFITLQPAPIGTPASVLLSLPATNQEDIACPLCDTTLHSTEPLDRAIQTLSDAVGRDTLGFTICVSHPQNVPETKTPPIDYPFQVQRHDKPLDSGLKQNLRESSPTFIVRPKENNK